VWFLPHPPNGSLLSKQTQKKCVSPKDRFYLLFDEKKVIFGMLVELL